MVANSNTATRIAKDLSVFMASSPKYFHRGQVEVHRTSAGCTVVSRAGSYL
jgi:hypothetical protein